MKHTILGRVLGTLAGASALALGVASTASAHHCYKLDWNDKAAEQQAGNGSPWTPLSTLGAMVIAQDVGMPECAGYSSVAIDHWMEETGTTSEPLIHLRATVGGGALHHNPPGRTARSIGYLTDADFAILEEGIGLAIAQCQADPPS